MAERHLATFNQQVLFANLPVRKALGHFQSACAFCKPACQKSTWPPSTSRCLSESTWPLSINHSDFPHQHQIGQWPHSPNDCILHVRGTYCQLATSNKQANFALTKSFFGHFQPASEFCTEIKQNAVWPHSTNTTFLHAKTHLATSSIEAFCNFVLGQKDKNIYNYI